MSIKTFISVLGLALLLSAGLNVWLLAGRDTSPDVAAPSGQSATSSRTGASSGAHSYNPDDLIACRHKLELCERRRKLGPLTLGTFQGSRGRDDDSPAEPPSNYDFLCSLARAQVQQHWVDRREEIVFVLRNTLANEAVQEQDVRAAVDRYAEGLGLSDAERTRFEDTYRDARLARIDTIRDALDDETPDFGVILNEVQALHADEDRITSDMFGPEAQQWLQDSEREARSSLLAIAATYAEIPWEEVIH